MTRLFVAVRPPRDVSEALAQLERPVDPELRWVPPDQWHVTVAFIGESDEHEVRDALAGAALPPAEATLGPAVELLGERVLVMPVSGLERLASSVAEAVRGLGDPPRHDFVGHLTLARLKRTRRLSGAPGAGPAQPPLDARVSARWRVSEIELVASVLTGRAAVHETVALFPLV